MNILPNLNRFCLTIVLLQISAYVIAQAPSNDECTSALTISFDCNQSISVDMNNATASGTPDNCATETGEDYGNADDDVWFKFIAISSIVDIKMNNISLSNIFFDLQLFKAGNNSNCNSLEYVACNFDEDPDNNQIIKFGELEPLILGDTYYLRISTYDDGFVNVQFDICLDAIFINDSCTEAQFITSDNDGQCDTWTFGNFSDAGPSGIGECDFSPAIIDQDLWYKFTATHKAMQLTSSMDIGVDRLTFEVFSGDCLNLVHKYCHDNPDNLFILPDLISGEEYSIKIGLKSGDPFTSDFSLCISSFFPPNDDCDSALDLAITDATCSVTNFGTVAGATSTAGISGCTLMSGDIWYSFVANTNNYVLSFSNFSETIGTGPFFYQLLSGSSCGALSSLFCKNSFSGFSTDISDLTVGQKYYVRIGFESLAAYASFDVCLYPVECSGIVTSAAVSGGGSLRNEIECADEGDIIQFSESLNNQVINLGAPTIIIDKDLHIVCDAERNISLTNNDVSNTQLLLDIKSSLRISGLNLKGTSDDAMLLNIGSAGDLILENSQMESVSVLKN